jgi:hypothetical protein
LSNKTRLHLLKKTTKENVLSYTGSAYSLFIRLGKNKYYAKKEKERSCQDRILCQRRQERRAGS